MNPTQQTAGDVRGTTVPAQPVDLEVLFDEPEIYAPVVGQVVEPEASLPRGLRSRAVWVIADQAVSSLSSAGLTIVLARAVDASSYGAFAVAFSVYTLMQSISQALSGQVITIRYSAERRDQQQRAAAAATGTAFLLGAAASLVLAVVGVVAHGPLRSALLAVALVMPVLLVQDIWRTVFISRGTPRQAFVNDLLWTVVQFGLFALLIAVSNSHLSVYLVCWGYAALLAAAYGIRQTRVAPAPSLSRWWLTSHRDTSVPSLFNVLATLGATQIAFVLIATIGSLSAVGSLRGTLTLLGPLNILGFAVVAFTIPELVRHHVTGRHLVLAALAMSGLLVAVDVVWGSVLLLLPQSAGRALLGDSWTGTRQALPGMIAFTAGIALSTGPNAVLRALNRTTYVLWTSLALGPLIVVLSVVGAELAGGRGAATGFFVASVVVLPATWWLCLRGVRRGRPTGTGTVLAA